MATKQAPPDGMQYDESSHQWVPTPAAPVEAPPEPAKPRKEQQS